MLRTLSAILCLLLLGCAEHDTPTTHWSYQGKTGPANWAALDPAFRLCASGKTQSPIKIPPATQTTPAKIKIAYKPFAAQIIHNGHTVQVNAADGNSFTHEGRIYRLLQFHFHTPAEYHLADKAYPLSAHFVHQHEDGTLAVIGIVFKEGAADSQLEKIWRSAPEKAGKPQKQKPILNPRALLPTKLDYYHFTGSLTTPPCSEGVKWFVFAQPRTASRAQITALHRLMGKNARPLQPINKRAIARHRR